MSAESPASVKRWPALAPLIATNSAMAQDQLSRSALISSSLPNVQGCLGSLSLLGFAEWLLHPLTSKNGDNTSPNSTRTLASTVPARGEFSTRNFTPKTRSNGSQPLDRGICCGDHHVTAHQFLPRHRARQRRPHVAGNLGLV